MDTNKIGRIDGFELISICFFIINSKMEETLKFLIINFGDE